jgi:large subunit ribosomal protein L19
MANKFTFKDASYNVGDTIEIAYKIKEGEKERIQKFAGIVMKIKGDSLETRMITARKMSRAGIGVERIIPLNSPFIANIEMVKKGTFRKSRLSFIRDLSAAQIRHKIYRKK